MNAFCSEAPDSSSEDCDVFITQRIPSLAITIFRVSVDPSQDIRVNPVNINTIYSGTSSLSYSVGSDQQTLEFVYTSLQTKNARSFSFDIRKYMNNYGGGPYVFKTMTKADSLPMGHSIQSITTYQG